MYAYQGMNHKVRFHVMKVQKCYESYESGHLGDRKPSQCTSDVSNY